MDLPLLDAEPTEAERAAVDRLLGPPGSSWEGGLRVVEVDGRLARGGHEARGRRHMLLPALHAVHERVGWITPGALNYVCNRLSVPPADAYGVATFYALFSLEPKPSRVIHVCDDIACRTNGATELVEELERRFGPQDTTDGEGDATWLRSPCLGQCDRAPAALLADAGEEPAEHVLAPVDLDTLLA